MLTYGVNLQKRTIRNYLPKFEGRSTSLTAGQLSDFLMRKAMKIDELIGGVVAITEGHLKQGEGVS